MSQPYLSKNEKRPLRKREHRQLTEIGVPRHKDGNRLGLRKRRDLAARLMEAGTL